VEPGGFYNAKILVVLPYLLWLAGLGLNFGGAAGAPYVAGFCQKLFQVVLCLVGPGNFKQYLVLKLRSLSTMAFCANRVFSSGEKLFHELLFCRDYNNPEDVRALWHWLLWLTMCSGGKGSQRVPMYVELYSPEDVAANLVRVRREGKVLGPWKSYFTPILINEVYEIGRFTDARAARSRAVNAHQPQYQAARQESIRQGKFWHTPEDMQEYHPEVPVGDAVAEMQAPAGFRG